MKKGYSSQIKTTPKRPKTKSPNYDFKFEVGQDVEYKTTYGVRSGKITAIKPEDIKSIKIMVARRNEAVYRYNVRPKGFYTNLKK